MIRETFTNGLIDTPAESSQWMTAKIFIDVFELRKKTKNIELNFSENMSM